MEGEASKLFDKLKIFSESKAIEELINGLIEVKKIVLEPNVPSKSILEILTKLNEFIKIIKNDPSCLKIAKIILLDPNSLTSFTELMEDEKCICVIMDILSVLSHNDVFIKNLIISKISETCIKKPKILTSNNWKTKSFESLLEICQISVTCPDRLMVIEEDLTSNLLRNIFQENIKKFQKFITIFCTKTQFNYFNLSLFERQRIPDILLDFLIQTESQTEDLWEVYFHFLSNNMPNNHFMKILNQICSKDGKNKMEFIRLFTKLSKQKMPLIFDYWLFGGIQSSDKFHLELLTNLNLKNGVSIVFRFSVYLPEHKHDYISPINLLWINSRTEPSSGFAFILNPSSSTYRILLIQDKHEIAAFDYSTIVDMLSPLTCMISLKMSRQSYYFCVSMASNTLYRQNFEIKAPSLQLQGLVFNFGCLPFQTVKAGENDFNSLSQAISFVGKLGPIHVVKHFGPLDTFLKPNLSCKYDTFLSPFDCQKNIIASVYPRNFFPCQQDLKDESSLLIDGISSFNSTHFNYYLENAGGALLYLFMLHAYFEHVRSKEPKPIENETKMAIEEILDAFLFLSKEYVTKSRHTFHDTITFFTILENFIYINNDLSSLFGIRILEFLSENIEISITEDTKNNNQWQPYFDTLMNPLIWSNAVFHVQAVKMQIISNYLAKCLENELLTSIPMDKMIYCLDLIDKSELNKNQKIELLQPIFKIFSHLLLSADSQNNLKIFFEYFLINVNSSFDLYALRLIYFLIANKPGIFTDPTPLFKFLLKTMKINDPQFMKVINALLVSIFQKPNLSKFIPNLMLSGWIFRLTFGCLQSESDIYYMIDTFLCLVSSTTYDSKAQSTHALEFMTNSLILSHKTSLKDRQRFICKFLKAISQNKAFIKCLAKIDNLEILLSSLMWRFSPKSLQAVFKNSLIGLQSPEKYELEMASAEKEGKKTVEDILRTTTLIQQLASLFLIIYKECNLPFQFLMSPIFFTELIGSSSLFFNFWYIKVIILNIYLRHFCSLDQIDSHGQKYHSQQDISVQIIELTSYIIMEIAFQDLSNISDQEIDLILESINYLGLAITKYLSFSDQHLHIPLFIVLRFINFGHSNIRGQFCSLLERSLSLCTPTLFHLCATTSVLYKISIDLNNDPSCIKMIRFYMDKILTKYINVFQNAGIGLVNVSSSSDSQHGNKMSDHTTIKSAKCYVTFNSMVWKQIVAKAETHPLFIGWLSNPSMLSERIRNSTSILFAKYVGYFEQAITYFFKNTGDIEIVKARYFESLNSTTYSKYSQIACWWNVYLSKINHVLGPDSQVHTLENSNYVSINIRPLVFPLSVSSNINKSLAKASSICKFYCAVDSLMFSQQSSRNPFYNLSKRSGLSFSVPCSFLYLNQLINGKICLFLSEFEFKERITAETVNEAHIYLNKPYSSVKLIFHCEKSSHLMLSGINFAVTFKFSSFEVSNTVLMHIKSYNQRIIIHSFLDIPMDIHEYLLELVNKNVPNLSILSNIELILRNKLCNNTPPKECNQYKESLCSDGIDFLFFYSKFFGDLNPLKLFLSQHTHNHGTNAFNKDPLSSILDFEEVIKSEKFIETFKQALHDKFPTENSADIKLQPSENLSTDSTSNYTKISISPINDVHMVNGCSSSSTRTTRKLSKIVFENLDFPDNSKIVAISIEPINSVSKTSTCSQFYLALLSEDYFYRYLLSGRKSHLSISGIFSNGSNEYFTLALSNKIKHRCNIGVFSTYKRIPSHEHPLLKQNSSGMAVVGGLADNTALFYGKTALLIIIKYHKHAITCVGLTDSGRSIFTASKDGVCCMWKPQIDHNKHHDNQIVVLLSPNQLFFGPSSEITTITHNKQTKTVLFCDINNEMYIFSCKNGLLVYKTNLTTVNMFDTLVPSISFSKSGFILVATTSENTSRIQAISPFGCHLMASEIPHRITSFDVILNLLVVVCERRLVKIYQANKLDIPILESTVDFDLDRLYFCESSGKFICYSNDGIVVCQLAVS